MRDYLLYLWMGFFFLGGVADFGGVASLAGDALPS